MRYDVPSPYSELEREVKERRDDNDRRDDVMDAKRAPIAAVVDMEEKGDEDVAYVPPEIPVKDTAVRMGVDIPMELREHAAFLVLFQAWQTTHRITTRAANDMLEIINNQFIIPKFTVDMIHNALDIDKRHHRTYVSCTECNHLHTLEQSTTTDEKNNIISAICRTRKWDGAQCKNKLMKVFYRNRNHKFLRPALSYPYNPLIGQLAAMLRRPGMEKKLEEWANTPYQEHVYSAITNGRTWRHFSDTDRTWFFKRDGTTIKIGLGINIDWMGMTTGMRYSTGVIYLYLLNLDAHDRILQHNSILIGIIPHNSKGTMDVNKYLKPLVDELHHLWKGVIMNTHAYPDGRLVRAAVILAMADAPATKKLIGSVAPTALNGCHKCDIKFGHVDEEYSGDEELTSGNDSSDDDNRERYARRVRARKKEQKARAVAAAANGEGEIPGEHKSKKTQKTRDYLGAIGNRRTTEQQNDGGQRWKRATTVNEQKKAASATSWKWSIMQELPYWNGVQFATVDTMHCMTLGVAKTMLYRMTNKWRPADGHHAEVNRRLSLCRFPRSLPRPIRSLQSDISTITAAQLEIFVASNSIFVLDGRITAREMRLWKELVIAQRICMRRTLSDDDRRQMKRSIIFIINNWQRVWPSSGGSPNLHMLLHLSECIKEYGAPIGFATWSMERWNGWFKDIPRNGIEIEHTMMRRQHEIVQLCTLETSYNGIIMNVGAQGIMNKMLRIVPKAGMFPDNLIASIRKLPRHDGIVNGSEPIMATMLKPRAMRPLPADLCSELQHNMNTIYYKDHRDIISADVTVCGTMADAIQLGYRVINSDASRSTRSAYIVANFPRKGGPLEAKNSLLTPGRVAAFVTVPVRLHNRDGTNELRDHTFVRVTWEVKPESASTALEDNGYSTAWKINTNEIQSWIPIGRIAGTIMPVHTKVKKKKPGARPGEKDGEYTIMYVCWLPPHF